MSSRVPPQGAATRSTRSGERLQDPENGTGQVSLEAAKCLLAALALAFLAGEVVTRRPVPASLRDGDPVQGAVELAVAERIQAMALLPPRRRLEWRDATVQSEGGIAVEARDVRGLSDQLGGCERAAARQLEQRRGLAGYERCQLTLELVRPPCQLPAATQELAADPQLRRLLAAGEAASDPLQPAATVERAGGDLQLWIQVVQVPAQALLDPAPFLARARPARPAGAGSARASRRRAGSPRARRRARTRARAPTRATARGPAGGQTPSTPSATRPSADRRRQRCGSACADRFRLRSLPVPFPEVATWRSASGQASVGAFQPRSYQVTLVLLGRRRATERVQVRP